MEYYANTCRWCGEDCDDAFCSWECKQEYEEGRVDYLYDLERERRMMEEDQFESDHAQELINRGGL